MWKWIMNRRWELKKRGTVGRNYPNSFKTLSSNSWIIYQSWIECKENPSITKCCVEQHASSMKQLLGATCVERREAYSWSRQMMWFLCVVCRAYGMEDTSIISKSGCKKEAITIFNSWESLERRENFKDGKLSWCLKALANHTSP